MLKKQHYFSDILHYWSTFLPSPSGNLCLALVSMKPLFLKSIMSSDWLAGPAIGQPLRACFENVTHYNQEFQHTTTTTQPSLVPFFAYAMGGNYLNEEY